MLIFYPNLILLFIPSSVFYSIPHFYFDCTSMIFFPSFFSEIFSQISEGKLYNIELKP